MEYRQLGQSGLKVSAIGLGCVTFGREIDAQTSFAIMDRAVEQGITLFDTAEAYAEGASERIIGNWLAARGCRNSIVLATKVAGSLTHSRVLSSAQASLQRLQTNTVDLFQVHRWDSDVPLAETLQALDTLVKQGLARVIGCSNYAAWQLRQALAEQDRHSWARMESVQPPYNLVKREIEQELLPLCADQQVGVISYSPLGAGFLTGKYRQGQPVPGGTRFDVIPGHQALYFNARAFQIVEGLRTKAATLNLPMAHLALAWTMAQPAITSVLVGARNAEQVDQAIQAQSLNLSPELIAEVGKL